MGLAVMVVSAWVVAALAGTMAFELVRRHRGDRERIVRAAHELRGSLTAIALGLELEAMGPRLPRRRALELEVARAKRALDDLSGVAHQRGAAPPEPARLERVDLGSVVAESVEAARPSAMRAGVELTGDWDGPPVLVWGDRVRLSQAIGNLIGNALEHGEGSVSVRTRSDAGLGPARGPGGVVRIEVSDDGPGLPAPVAVLARRAKGGRGQRGRGLAIAGVIAAHHGGRLAAAPAARGARLVLELPVSVAPVHAAPGD